MKLTYFTSAGLLFLFLFSCKKESNFNAEPVTAEARAGAPTTRLSMVPLVVTITHDNGISHDGDPTYKHGTQNVSAVIRDTDGQFFFTANTTFKTPIRRLTFPFRSARDFDGKLDYRIVTSFPSPLQNMNYPGVTLTAPAEQLGGVRVWSYETKSVEAFAMRYRYGLAVPPDPATSQIKVTRTSENTWELLPIQTSTGTVEANLKIGTADMGRVNDVGFTIKLQRKI